MQAFFELLKAHYIAIVLALFAATIVAAPQVVFRMQHGDTPVYQGIELMPDSSWSPRVREIMDGHGLGSMYYKDGKNDPYLFQPLGSMTVAYMGMPFGLNINDSLLLGRFVLTAVAFLLMYAFVFLFARDRVAALASASVLLLADGVTSLSGLKTLLSGVAPTNFLTIDLPVNPAMIYIPALLFLTAFFLYYKKGGWPLGILSAGLLGLNFYSYFYTWTFLYAVGGFLVLHFLFQRNIREALRLGAVYVGALPLAIPMVLNLLRASQYPTFEAVGIRQGILLTHEPAFIGLTALLALLIYVALFPRTRSYPFGLALLLSPFVTLNQQILTGKEMQPAHYHWYFHKPLAILLLIVLGFFLLRRYTKPWVAAVAGGVLIAACFGVGMFVQADSYTHIRGDYTSLIYDQQRYGPLMRWFNEHAQKEDAVLANEPISSVIIIYTPLNVAHHRGAPLTLPATEERILDSLFMFYRLSGLSAADAKDAFHANRGIFSRAVYGIYWRQATGSYDAIPDSIIDRFAAQYREALQIPAEQWFRQKLKQYDVSWVVWDMRDEPQWNTNYAFLREAVRMGDFVVYRVEL